MLKDRLQFCAALHLTATSSERDWRQPRTGFSAVPRVANPGKPPMEIIANDRMETKQLLLRLEDLQPVRAPETFAPDELVIVVGEVPVIAELSEIGEVLQKAA